MLSIGVPISIVTTLISYTIVIVTTIMRTKVILICIIFVVATPNN